MSSTLCNTCPKCGGPTSLQTMTFEQNCSSCNRIETLEAALQSIKDDYEFCRLEHHAPDRAHAYYETACKALTKEEL